MISTRDIVPRLKVIESLAIIPRVSSTNLIARRIVNECIENELSLPQAMIVAREQYAGRGRNERSWSSPPGKGIYATTLLTRSIDQLPLLPLQMANIVATFLRDQFGANALVKWPNDVLVGGRKIAGVLIEARSQDQRVFAIIGTGVNVEPVTDDPRLNATAISEVAAKNFGGLEPATIAFIEHVDHELSQQPGPDAILSTWRSLTVHQPGDRITSVVGERSVTGTWEGIDDQGRALLRKDGNVVPVSAGELIAEPQGED